MLGVEVPSQAVADVFIGFRLARLIDSRDKVRRAPGQVGQLLIEFVVVGPILDRLLDGFSFPINIPIED